MTLSLFSNISSRQWRYSFMKLSLLTAFIFLSGCSLLPQQDNEIKAHQALLNQYPDIATRIAQVKRITHWATSGKVAFIDKNNRQSASFNWLLDQNTQRQQLDLTSFLGINVLHIESANGQHVVEVENNTYQGEDLDDMLYQLANITLPTKALSYWIKGLRYLPSDQITYNEQSHFPETLTSHFKNQQWQVRYQSYQPVTLLPKTNNTQKSVALAKMLTLKNGNLTIKLNINRWNIL